MQTLETGITKAIKDLFVPNPSILMTPPPTRNPETGALSKLNLLFLDIDGVLNGSYTQAAFETLPFPDSGNKEAGYVYDAHAADIIAAKLINQLCKSTGALIVLSSSWRIGFSMEQIPTMLETLGIDPSYVIGRTDTLHESGMTLVRGNQVQRFLDDIITVEGRERMFKYDMLGNGVKFEDKVVVQTYAIVDDDDDFLESQKGNFVKTTFLEGLQMIHIFALGRILSNDETFYQNHLNPVKPNSLWM